MHKGLSSLFLFYALSWQLADAVTTSVWQVSNGDNRLFLGGTVHILSASDYPLPCAFDRAFSQADEVYFETDISAIETPEFLAKLIQKGSYSDGKSILNLLSENVQKELIEYFTDSNIPSTTLLKFKPGMLLSALTLIELQKLGITSAGVDKHFMEKARQAGKSIKHLESPDMQLDFLLALGEGNEDNFVRYLLASLTELSEQFDGLMQSWRSGDIEHMAKVSEFELLKEKFPSIYQSLLKKRNFDWLKKIDLMMQDADTEYVLVGGLHMVGEIGLVNQLSKKGYQISQLNVDCG